MITEYTIEDEKKYELAENMKEIEEKMDEERD